MELEPSSDNYEINKLLIRSCSTFQYYFVLGIVDYIYIVQQNFMLLNETHHIGALDSSVSEPRRDGEHVHSYRLLRPN